MSRIHDFSPSSSWTATHTGYGPGNPSLLPGDGQLGWDHHAPFRVFNNRMSGASAAGYRPFEERVIPASSFGETSIPMDPYSRPTRIIIVNNNTGYGTSPRPPPLFLREFTRRPLLQGNRHTSTGTADSRLTKEEQETVLKKLQRQTYNPLPKMSRRVSLYYRDLNQDADANASSKNKDEDDKNCAVCLEDFEAGEDVMLTPCKHMYHEECIVPWVKNHGKCPVCRSALYERVREKGSGLNRSTATVQAAEHGLFADELLSLVQAVDDAFVLGG